LEPTASSLSEATAAAAWHDILGAADVAQGAQLGELAASVELGPQLSLALAGSRFIATTLRQSPDLLIDLWISGDLQRSYDESIFSENLTTLLINVDTLEGTLPPLRLFRRREMVRLLWRDFNRSADMAETTRDVSLMAEAAIALTLPVLQAELEAEIGVPRSETGERQQLLVIAMGKLGARELNVSSDIDLIFAYPEAGETDGAARPVSNQEFFIKLGQRLITALDKVTSDGFVFRVDMRLRPYGESGSLVLNLAALEEYYQSQGRDWERYAMIKARAISGDATAVGQLEETLRPFVYRRYIDFGAIDALRDMKGMISAEVRRRGLDADIKLGSGGIREVEFIAQCFQLIRGGRQETLRQRGLLAALRECQECGLLPEQAVIELSAAYFFLRNVEHAIQGYEDRQTQSLPTDEFARAALLAVMACADWEQFLLQLDGHRSLVRSHFQAVIASPDEAVDGADSSVDIKLWPNDIEAADLEVLGFLQAEASSTLLQELRDSTRVRILQGEGRTRLDAFMPRLLATCAEQGEPDQLLNRLLPLVNAVLRRSAYLALLLENPGALSQLVRLCGASPWISRQLARNPVLLDELLDSRTLYSAPQKQRLQSELQQQLARVPMDDHETQLEALRYFKASQTLRVAACEISGLLPLMKVSDNLTFIAEVILEHVLALAWHDLEVKYGAPDSGEEADSRFAIVAYGKLGGLELGYGSDLDLVFVFDAPISSSTDGERSIDNTVFYTRLGQRILHILTTQTVMGALYEVDMRLRPSGDSGLLVTSLNAYRDYQQGTAWTWEHQALVRARVVAGSARLGALVEQMRQGVLRGSRDEVQLAGEVVAMRQRMRDHLLPGNLVESDHFHLKQGRGGIVDIEFMVQYAVLAWSQNYPSLARWTDNIRILETLEDAALFTPVESEALTQAYITYRSRAHEMALQQVDAVVEVADLSELIATVCAKWEQLFGKQE
jgi:glutamate-ammonia-ligase adenylyltransferase